MLFSLISLSSKFSFTKHFFKITIIIIKLLFVKKLSLSIFIIINSFKIMIKIKSFRKIKKFLTFLINFILLRDFLIINNINNVLLINVFAFFFLNSKKFKEDCLRNESIFVNFEFV